MRSRLLPALRRFRQALHAQPRVANDEGDTAHAIVAFLREQSGGALLPFREGVGGGHGLVYSISGGSSSSDGGGGGGTATVLLRGDMDALPLVECPSVTIAKRPHRSQVLGAHHACGHDGHTAMLVGALLNLHEERAKWGGRVIAVFQPAEETGEGAWQMLRAEPILLSSATVNRGAFGLHNIPGAPLGRVLLRESGGATRASCGVRVELSGRASHASEPHLGLSPLRSLSALAATIESLPATLSSSLSPQVESALATPVHLAVGHEDFGVYPAHGRLCATLRADATTDVEMMRDAVVHAAKREAAGGPFTGRVSEVEPFPATVNDARAAATVAAAAAACGAELERMRAPFPWGEDFAVFAHACGGALFGLGAGEAQPPLHSKTFDFPDDLLPIGVELWTEIARRALVGEDVNGAGPPPPPLPTQEGGVLCEY